MTQTQQQIYLLTRSSGVALITLDCPGKANVLTSEVMRELGALILAAQRDESITALAIVSGKADNFCLGADLREISRVSDRQIATRMSQDGQHVFNKLAALGKPTVAGIHGSCLGGGLELALACSYRIASDDPHTRFALPEVNLGIIPALGGTQRLPRLVGLQAAISMILNGEALTSARGYAIGLVDELVPADRLLARVEEIALALIAGRENLLPPRALDAEAPISNEEPDGARHRKLFGVAERSMRMRTRGNYPAPAKAIEAMKLGLAEGIAAGLELESKSFGELAVGRISDNLIFLFLNTEYARKAASSLADQEDLPFSWTVGVVGGGTMGISIAHLVATAGHDVLLRTVRKENLAEAMERLQGRFLPARVRQAPGEKQQEALKRVQPIDSDEPLASADLVIEAAKEELKLKAELFKRLSHVVKPDCLLATNTSSLSISAIAAAAADPSRVLGMHFFQPVEKMALVEVIAQHNTSRQALTRAVGFVSRLGKVPVVVRDSPGFLVNRLLSAYLLEAARLAEQGVPLNWLEDAAIDFGMPQGPLTLIDDVGIDLCATVGTVLNQYFGERLSPPPVLDKVLKLGLKGRKTGSGIYRWDESGRRLAFEMRLVEELGLNITDERLALDQVEPLMQRLLLPMIDEAARCLEEGVVRRSREIDLAMVLGLGFPPFRGGLLKYADTLGAGKVLKILDRIYNDEPGPAREISPLLRKMEAEGRSFYARGAISH